MTSVIGVVALDGSEAADEAFKWYLNYFHKPEHTVYFFYSPETYVNIKRFDMSPARAMELQREADEKTQSLQKKCKEMSEASNMKAAFEFMPDMKPGAAIVKFASNKNAAFIVMGSRGMGTIKGALYGSVSTFVLNHARCSVLICPPKKK